MPHFVYILESIKDGTYYVGSTNNLKDRVERHNQGRVKYTKPKRPWKLIYSEEHSDRSSAANREYAIKNHKRRAFVETLIKGFQAYFSSGYNVPHSMREGRDFPLAADRPCDQNQGLRRFS